MTVLGADVWHKGWVGIEVDHDLRFVRSHVSANLGTLIANAPGVGTVTVDIPLGLGATAGRRADGEAYALLGPRRSSVFPTAPRPVLELEVYEDANQLHRTMMDGKGLSRQSYGLRTRILEADAIYHSEVRLYEVHPEVCFAKMGGKPCSSSKKTWAGQADRRQRLASVGMHIPDDVGAANEVPVDDVLDAAAAAWSADRIRRGAGGSLPHPPEINDRGQRMAIWF
jgi:predicted RNase H-like nuclease